MRGGSRGRASSRVMVPLSDTFQMDKDCSGSSSAPSGHDLVCDGNDDL